MTANPDILLRPATRSDLEAILAACEETLERHVKGLPFAFSADAFNVFYAPYITACIDTQSEDQNAGLIEVATIEDQLAGYVILAEAHSPAGGLEIFDIHVFDPFRQQGVGHTLVEWCKSRMEELAAPNLEAMVWTLGDARSAFFEKAGFTKLNETWRTGSMTPRKPPKTPQPTEDWGVFTAPSFLWGLIAVLAVLLVLR